MHLLQPDWKISAGFVDRLFEDLFTVSTKVSCVRQSKELVLHSRFTFSLFVIILYASVRVLWSLRYSESIGWVESVMIRQVLQIHDQFCNSSLYLFQATIILFCSMVSRLGCSILSAASHNYHTVSENLFCSDCQMFFVSYLVLSWP